jgi:hypothetical protein
VDLITACSFSTGAPVSDHEPRHVSPTASKSAQASNILLRTSAFHHVLLYPVSPLRNSSGKSAFRRVSPRHSRRKNIASGGTGLRHEANHPMTQIRIASRIAASRHAAPHLITYRRNSGPATGCYQEL